MNFTNCWRTSRFLVVMRLLKARFPTSALNLGPILPFVYILVGSHCQRTRTPFMLMHSSWVGHYFLRRWGITYLGSERFTSSWVCPMHMPTTSCCSLSYAAFHVCIPTFPFGPSLSLPRFCYFFTVSWTIVPYIVLCGVALWFYFTPWLVWDPFYLRSVLRPPINFSPRIVSIFARRDCSSHYYTPKRYNLVDGAFTFHFSGWILICVQWQRLLALPPHFYLFHTFLPLFSLTKARFSGSPLPFSSALFVLSWLPGGKQPQISQVILLDGVVLPGLFSRGCLVSSSRFVGIGPVTRTRDTWSSALKTNWILLLC